MKNILSAILSICLLLPAPAFSQEPDQKIELPSISTPEGEKDPGKALSPMKMLQKAPFSGILLSPKVVAEIVSRLNSVDQLQKIAADEAREQEREVCKNEKNNNQIKFDSDKSILQAQIEYNKNLVVAYEKQLEIEKSSHIPGGVWYTLGAVSGTAITILSVFAIAQAVK